jgi:hypothetical protein
MRESGWLSRVGVRRTMPAGRSSLTLTSRIAVHCSNRYDAIHCDNIILILYHVKCKNCQDVLRSLEFWSFLRKIINIFFLKKKITKTLDRIKSNSTSSGRMDGCAACAFETPTDMLTPHGSQRPNGVEFRYAYSPPLLSFSSFAPEARTGTSTTRAFRPAPASTSPRPHLLSSPPAPPPRMATASRP